MKRLLTYLMCLELIIGPSLEGLVTLTQSAWAQETCPQGFQWDSTLNRCLTSAETANVITATSNCGPDDVDCYRSNAESALQKKQNEGEVKSRVSNKNGFVSTVLNAAAVAVPITMAIQGLKEEANSKCASISYYALVAGGVSLFVGDTWANMQHKKRLKDIEKSWDKILNPGASDETNADNIKANATEAQSQAFEMLARSEDSLAKAAKTKSTFYSIAMGAFAVSTALSIYEQMNITTIASSYCASDASKQQKDASPGPMSDEEKGEKAKKSMESMEIEAKSKKVGSIFNQNDFFQDILHLTSRKQKLYNLAQSRDLSEFYILHNEFSAPTSSTLDEFESIKNFTIQNELNDPGIFSLVKAIALKALTEVNPLPEARAQSQVGASVAATAAGIAFRKSLPKVMTTPKGRAAVSGVLFGWSMIMNNHAKSQASASGNRSKALRKMKEEFKSASGAINQCTANDRNDTSKPQCYCYTSEGQRNSNRGNSKICQTLFTGKDFPIGNYYGNTADAIKGCINSSRQYDENCSCKQSSQGCLKTVQGSIQGLNPGTFSMMSSALSPVANLSNGSLDTASVNAASLENNALRVMNAAKEMEKKLDPKVRNEKEKTAKAFENAALKASSGVPSNLLGSSGSSFIPANAKEAASMLEKELENSSTTPTTIGGATPVAPSITSEPQLEFGLTQGQLAVQETQIAEVMKEDLDYGQNDINNKSSTNIFEVLSNRYQRSGMRRLFDEKGVTKPEAANKTDITE